MKNIMEATLRRGLEPVNAAEDKAESLFERSEFDGGPVASYTGSKPWNLSDWNSILQIYSANIFFNANILQNFNVHPFCYVFYGNGLDDVV